VVQLSLLSPPSYNLEKKQKIPLDVGKPRFGGFAPRDGVFGAKACCVAR